VWVAAVAVWAEAEAEAWAAEGVAEAAADVVWEVAVVWEVEATGTPETVYPEDFGPEPV
jgi:hypothetical protein